METKKWESYEEVAQYLLNQFAETFGLGTVEGKQIIPGKSGTNWEIDAKGIKTDGDGFLIIECRRYTTSRLSQESLGAIAYRIKDTGAGGGIVVSPLEFQKGAKKVADHEGIHHVILDPKSTTSDYMLKFLNQIFVGISDTVKMSDKVQIQVIRNGKVVEERSID
ncbi:MAG: restriction endonuclease [Desulfobacterales bacterium]